MGSNVGKKFSRALAPVAMGLLHMERHLPSIVSDMFVFYN